MNNQSMTIIISLTELGSWGLPVTPAPGSWMRQPFLPVLSLSGKGKIIKKKNVKNIGMLYTQEFHFLWWVGQGKTLNFRALDVLTSYQTATEQFDVAVYRLPASDQRVPKFYLTTLTPFDFWRLNRCKFRYIH